MYEINIIPFTDIVLVILVVFIVTTPMLIQSAIKINLPQTTVQAPPSPEDKVTVTILENNQILLGNQPVKSLEDLEAKFKAQRIYALPVVVNADARANYGIVAQVLGVAQKCGASKLELLAKNESK